VVGVGHFGDRALRELRDRHPHWSLIAVDRDAEALAGWQGAGVATVLGDGVGELDRRVEDPSLTWVVPAVPFHLAHAWVVHRVSRRSPVDRIPVPAHRSIPNPIAGDSGDLYASYATFRCPEHCSEPREACTVSGKPRPIPLFRLLGRLRVDGYRVLGLRSHQLGPGVGGLRAAELRGLLAKVEGASGNLILYTACRCHGVLSGLALEPGPCAWMDPPTPPFDFGLGISGCGSTQQNAAIANPQSAIARRFHQAVSRNATGP
jgi:hypothetical protein